MSAKSLSSPPDRKATAAAISYRVNGQDVVAAATRLDRLLDELGYAARVATAVNGAFVAASARGETRLAAGDRIEIVAPRQGG